MCISSLYIYRRARIVDDVLFVTSQNMQSTSQRAMKSGDASTIAELVVSHQKCLQLLLEQNLHLEAHVRDMESMKANLTLQIHRFV